MIKQLRVLLVFVSLLFLHSCMPKNYYQVYKAHAGEGISIGEHELVYEDDHCKVSYDFWSEGGEFGFRFYNKTDNNIYVDLERSFFIRNGAAKNYYKGRTFTNATSFGLVTSSTVSYEEERVVCVPSHSYKFIQEYQINEDLIRDCYLLKYPTRRQVSKIFYSQDDSPLVFSNRIAYRIDGSDSLNTFENAFYLAEVSNIPEGEMFYSRYASFCEEESMIMSSYFKMSAPNMFYIKYVGGADNWSH